LAGWTSGKKLHPTQRCGRQKDLVNSLRLSYNTPMLTEEKIARQLTTRGQTLSTAESCTGGLLAHHLTNVPGSSSYFTAGIVTYSNAAKQRQLKVPAGTLKKHGAVSPKVAGLMAQGVRRLFRTDYGIGITGIAGPGGGSPDKPVGLVYIAVTGRQVKKSGTVVKKYRFQGSRRVIKDRAVAEAGKLFLRFING